MCRIVVLAREMPGTGSAADTRVTECASLPLLSAETSEALAAVRGRRANVVVWNARSEHRLLSLPHGTYERVWADARARLRDEGRSLRGMLLDVAPASSPDRQTGDQAVMLATASIGEVSAALRPVLSAGIRVGSVLTPPAALLSLARLRGTTSTPGAFEAYVALDETEAFVAVIRDLRLVDACRLPWGYLEHGEQEAFVRSRDDLAARLAADLHGLVEACRQEGSALEQIAICSGLPDLRSMTAGLVECLDIEVEPLDSLFGINPVHLADRAGELHDSMAGLRLAWAAAADGHPPLDLYRTRRRHEVRKMVARGAVAAGVAAGLGFGWLVQNWWPAVPAVTAGAPGQDRPRASPGPRLADPVPAAIARAAARPTPPLVRPRPAVQPALVAAAAQPAFVAPAAQPAFVAPAAQPVSLPARAQDVLDRAAVRLAPPRLAAGPVREEVPQAAPVPARLLTARPAAAMERPALPAAPGAEVALGFDATLGTILYSDDRRLAIVDGRIVGEGDLVGDVRVVEITSSAVLFRDPQGRLRRLTIGVSR
jgi:hypothetical protein